MVLIQSSHIPTEIPDAATRLRDDEVIQIQRGVLPTVAPTQVEIPTYRRPRESWDLLNSLAD